MDHVNAPMTVAAFCLSELRHRQDVSRLYS
jgi:hypothetical protein